MNQNKFQLFLQQMKIKERVKLNYVTVKKKNKQLVFDLTFEHVLSPQNLTLFLNSLTSMFKAPGVASVDFVLHYENIELQKHAKEYFEFIVHRASEVSASVAVLKNYQIEYENSCYSILVEKDAGRMTNHLKILKNHFAKFGLHVEIDIKVSEALVSVSEVVSKHMEEIEASLAKQHQVAEREQIIDKKRNFSRRSDPSAVSINEIPTSQYELDKYMNQKGDTSFLIEGEVFKKEFRKLKSTNLLTLSIFDEDDAIIVKRFVRQNKDIELANQIEVGDFIQVSGRANYDTFSKEVVLNATAIHQLARKEKQTRQDKSKQKRIEFHLHTQMSNMDAVTSASKYVDTLVRWGHEAFAVTDRNGIYAFPEIHKATKGKNIKPIYGAEMDYVNDYAFKIAGDYDQDLSLKDATYVVFDVETTGLSSVRDKIIEIAAVKVKGFEIVERYQSFVNPHEKLSEFTKQLTNITDEMVSDAPHIEDVLPQFLTFAKDCVLVAHNAEFDMSVLYETMRKLDLHQQTFPWIDTLNLARYFYRDQLKRFNLKAVAKLFKVTLEAHHRAINDAEATANIFIQMLQNLYKEEISTYFEINASLEPDLVWKHPIPKTITILAQNQIGYKNLFKMVSDSLTTHYAGGARLPRSVIDNNREGILVGSSADLGYLFDVALYKNEKQLEEAMTFYDYVEVSPPKSYAHLVNGLGNHGQEVIRATLQKIIKTAKALDKHIIATSNAHYLDPEDKKYRDIYIHTKSVGGGLHPYATYDVSPQQHLLTTQEMLEAFSFLGETLAHEIVIDNTKKLNALIEHVQAFPKELYSIADDAFKETLGISSIADHIKTMVYEKAHLLYGSDLHFMIKERVERELESIIGNEFAPIYFISHLLVKKSLDDGYLVGSRGSVGSSLVATLLEITEVNPMRPHYRCPNGDYTVFKMTDDEIYEHGLNEFDTSFMNDLKEAKSGYDLPHAICPICGSQLKKDGHDIPFETFLGFDGDKVPDIDLNFSGDYQAKAHAYVRELLGEDFTFRAGTIQTVAQRNAFGYVKGYLEDRNLNVRNAMIERLAAGIEGTRRSTGQHPGGIVVVPKNKSIYDVTPVQYPADDTTSAWKTTHFDYHSFEDNLLKLDILGHDDPTMIKYLMDYVKENKEDFPFEHAQDIPLDDKKVYQLFTGTKIVGFSDDLYGEVASYAIPEFGTSFTRQMLVDTKPDTFAGLVKISGLSHGTDVWLKNAQDLVLGKTQYGKIDFNQIIGCRDDIMVELSEKGLKPLKAFEIMEFVRKGKPSSNFAKWQTYESEMKNHKVPDWYIWSASQIKYMFPKAHATAYVIMAMRIAWFKVYKPLLFYSAFFSKRVDTFDYETMVDGANAIRNKIISYREQTGLKVKDESLIVILHIAYEMTKRGFKFLPVDIEKSDATTFVMENGGLRMPFTTIDGLGSQVAEDIVTKRKEKPFTSKKDVQNRTKLNKTSFEKLTNYGAFDNLVETTADTEQGLFAQLYE